MIFADICKPIYEACPKIKSQEKYIDGLLGAAGGVLISDSYKKQLFIGESNGKKKNLTVDLRTSLRGKNKQSEIEKFFYDNIDDGKVQGLIVHFGIAEKDKPNKPALCYALAMQLQALIDTDDEEAVDVINAMYQQAKAGNAVSSDKVKEYGAKYLGDQIWVEEMGKVHEVNCYQTFTHIWTIHNQGKIVWSGRKIICVNQNEVKPQAHILEIEVPETAPNKIIKLRVDVDTKTMEGKYSLRWIMVDEDGENCFNHDSSLDINVTVSFSE